MEMMEALQIHIDIALAHYVTVLLLCVCGIVLNVLLLVLFFRKKQVRKSVYTTYMIQIAVTDCLVCIVWLVMAAMYLDELPSENEMYGILQSNNDTTINEAPQNKRKNFPIYRFTYAMYNFHYYNNIFLLATMSIERCVAVWKSLRCQRYEFNRKFICAISIFMWLLALACSLPSFIDPNLITQSEQTDLMLQNLNATKEYNYGVYALSSTLLSCTKPLSHAMDNNESFVRDYDGVSVKECLRIMMEYDEKYNGSVEAKMMESFAVDLPETPNSSYALQENVYDHRFDELTEDSDIKLLDEDNFDGGSLEFPITYYKMFLNASVTILNTFVINGDIDNLCDPRLSEQAKYYQVIVNLLIGFFIPFAAILVTNLAIAFMIGNRARHRLENDTGDEGNEDSTVRRMSSFLRYFGQKSESKIEGDVSGIYKRSPVLMRKTKARYKMEKNRRTKEQTSLLDNKKKPKGATIKLQPATPSTSPIHACGPEAPEFRPHLSSFSAMQIRESASSAESFPTDLTSLHTTSPSPGVRLSAPLFLQNDGKVGVQRACSADGSTTGSGCSHHNQTPARRWSSEVFKANTLGQEKKAKSDRDRGDRHPKEPRSGLGNNDGIKIASPLPSRIENTMVDSTQALLPDHQPRMHGLKTKAVIRQGSSLFDDRERACSVVSRTSGAGERKKRKTLVLKQAERQMRISNSILAYVLVFAICWFPQRIVTIIYVTEGFMGKDGVFCHLALSSTRILSFFSVLLNPIVYAVTQRELRHYLRLAVNWVSKCVCPHKWLQKKTPSSTTVVRNDVQRHTGTSANDKGRFSAIVLNNLTTEKATRQERHARNKERWSRVFQRLGRKNFHFSMSASVMSSQGGKPSDGTIDEEREDEKGQSSKAHSLSASNKTDNKTNGFEDTKQLIVMASPHGDGSEHLNDETIL